MIRELRVTLAFSLFQPSEIIPIFATNRAPGKSFLHAKVHVKVLHFIVPLPFEDLGEILSAVSSLNVCKDITHSQSTKLLE